MLGALVSAGTAMPGHGLVPRAAAASCSGWSSSSTPPPTIRVFRHVTGAVETVDFRAYTQNVLSREWIASWTTESLRSGALAVKNYAWYQVLHWRGGTNVSGECFDLRDDTWDQVYDPSKPTYSTAAAAVDDTWGTLVLKNGAIFPTYYNAGSPGEGCGANANGWKAYQWGTQACGLAGRTAAQIIQTYYYPGVTVSGGSTPTATPLPTTSPTPTLTPTPSPVATPGSTPTLAPTPTPAVTPSPSPAPTSSPTSGSAASPAPSATPTLPPAPSLGPTPSPTAPPTATPLPTPSPTPVPPPADQQLPGGGQASVEYVSAPPAPPPADPDPVVATAQPEGERHPAPAGADLRWAAGLERLRQADVGQEMTMLAFRLAHLEAGMHGGVVVTHSRATAAATADLRLATFPSLWNRAVDNLVAAFGERLPAIIAARDR